MKNPANKPNRINCMPALAACLYCLLILGSAVVKDASAQVEERRKIAQTGMKFLSLSLDPRAAAMADAMTSLENGAASLFYNPAGMARLPGLADAMIGQTQWIADIDYNLGSIAFSPAGGRFGVIGLSVMTVDYGTLQETIRWDNEDGYLDMGEFNPTSLAVGLGYARAITDRFSVGGQVKYVFQDLYGGHADGVVVSPGNGDFTRRAPEQSVLGFDFGVLYLTGYRSFAIAMSVRNFSQEIRYEQEGFQLPLTFKLGASMNLVDFTTYDPNVHSFMLSVDAERPRDFYEQIKVGTEYTFMNTFSLRGGFMFPSDEQSYTLGAGIRQAVGGVGFGVDYAYADLGVFSHVHRLALQFSF